ncbi:MULTISPECIES: phosphatidate cytidylyltransferase [Bosea]|uniref:phosphatidate cytidylyltransferase n=1 Tax=Bosea TaxID=85413 RepID=UPI00214F75AA|nr:MULTISPECIES: phosphatidate cytidylyltransferase [Bosea]MCR4521844.1 phosphatidate cytidylyltransferase [Bosea sp. 47.2.35]MDR6827367.1 phosphatidate cytidylyltransferase [Bosea robiniae]MDR6894077.1 phosphatidate cytidylyltransferase [Bosea sp. BE109]MDR7137472.1 phosphatidate cytidylyltransferase [Bosea sp. BE168]MDR7174172.1 phosphatidate cytidylyltransferase [Bosea sp. BE271]
MNAPSPSAPRANSELRLRVASALVLGALVLLVTLWGGWPFRLVWILVAGLVAYEWLAIVGRGNAIPAGIGVIATGLVLSYSPASPAALAGTAAAAALLGALATPFVRSRLALELCGVAYALAFALVTPALRDLPQIGLALILWSFAVVWLTDIAAYFTGRKLGGPKLMPAVSPKKTWSGAIGGAVAGMVGGYLVWRLMPSLQGVTAAGPVIAASLAGSIVSQAGDLFESSLKRRFDAKDSSKLIPGHGGFLDRLDGYWAVLVLAGFALFALHLNI